MQKGDQTFQDKFTKYSKCLLYQVTTFVLYELIWGSFQKFFPFWKISLEMYIQNLL